MLPPAHYLSYDLSTRSIALHRYWNIRTDYFEELGVTEVTEEDAAERIIDVLRASVRRRLISDVPVGFFLSGGLDSSLSTAIAASESSGTIKTFTLVYPQGQATEGKFEDQRFAREIARQYGTEHHEELMDFTDFCHEFPRIISHFDEPFAGVLSTYFLARLIARHVKVALSGDAADELFGSYLSHRLAYPLYNYRNFAATGEECYRDFSPYENNLSYLQELNDENDWRWRFKLLVFSEDDKRSLYSDELRQATAGLSTERHLASYFDHLASRDPLNRILEAEFLSFFPDQVLAFSDRLSMAHSLEVRTAFLDPEFIHLAFSIHGSMKRTGGNVKSILKKAALRYLPSELVYRQKEGFVLPINQWLLADMEVYVRENLSHENLKNHGFFNEKSVNTLVNDFYSGKKELANRVLNILTFQVWYDLYFSRQATP